MTDCTPPELVTLPVSVPRILAQGTYSRCAVFAGLGSGADLPTHLAEPPYHTRTTTIRSAFGRSGSSTSLFMSSGSLVSNTIGRSNPRAVAATTASMAHLWPESPVAPSGSPARRAIWAVTGTTVTLDSTRCTVASRGPPRSVSVRVIALTATWARRARALSRYARMRASPAASFETPSLSRTRVPPATTRRPAMRHALLPGTPREQSRVRQSATRTTRRASPVLAGG